MLKNCLIIGPYFPQLGVKKTPYIVYYSMFSTCDVDIMYIIVSYRYPLSSAGFPPLRPFYFS